MELAEYLKLIYRYRWLVLACVLVFGGGAYLFAVTRPNLYEAKIDLFVQRQPDGQSDLYFTYDGFYAQQTAAAYTDNALELLKSDEIIRRGAEKAGIPLENNTANKLRGSIDTEKVASQLINLAVVRPGEDEAGALAAGLADALSDRTQELNQQGDKKMVVAAVNPTPTVVMVRPLDWLYALIGIVIGFVIGASAAAVLNYLRPHRRR